VCGLNATKLNEELDTSACRDIARLMCIAARTAPKTRGIDRIVTRIVEGEEEKAQLAAEMRRLGATPGNESMIRDAGNLEKAKCIVLIGTRLGVSNLAECGFCGFGNCTAAEAAGARCAFNTIDLGIAVGSAVAMASWHHVDNRVMRTIGAAAVNLGFLGDDVKVALGIPLSISGKNPFFDRK